jgi:flagellar basal-body rod protein FlgG
MIRGLYTSSAGMQVESLRQEALANNLANLNTAGFRRDLSVVESRKNMRISEMRVPNTADPIALTHAHRVGPLGTGVDMKRFVKDFTQGDMRDTGNPYDLALQGPGFFTFQGPKGQVFYSRDGQLSRASDGTLVDKTGNKLMGQNGPIVATGKLDVTPDGTIMIDGQATDKITLVNFQNPDDALIKHGDSMFQAMPGAVAAPMTSTEVRQNTLENANVNSIDEMVHMIAAMRQYEANQKSVQAQDETLQHAVNDIAK